MPGNVVRLAVGLAGLVALLALLATTVGLGIASWVVGLGCAAVLTTLVTVGLAHAGHTMGPADLVTLGRGLMACAVAALTVELLLGHQVTPVVLALTVPALALDAVDGRVARRTGTVTAFGGRFDGEVDAFLILVLSVAAAPDGRVVGARRRPGALRLRRRGMVAAVDARDPRVPVLAQGGDRGRGDRARRGRRGRAAGRG